MLYAFRSVVIIHESQHYFHFRNNFGVLSQKTHRETLKNEKSVSTESFTAIKVQIHGVNCRRASFTLIQINRQSAIQLVLQFDSSWIIIRILVYKIPISCVERFSQGSNYHRGFYFLSKVCYTNKTPTLNFVGGKREYDSEQIFCLRETHQAHSVLTWSDCSIRFRPLLRYICPSRMVLVVSSLLSIII